MSSIKPATNEIELRAPEKNTPKTQAPKTQVNPNTGTAKNTSETMKATETTNMLEANDQPPVVTPVTNLETKASIVSEPQPVPEPVAELISEPEDSVAKPAPDLAKIMPVLMKQAAKISTPEVQDQAYLDIVNFSVSQRQFKFADAAMREIKQTELRDTARSQIALGLAMDGRTDDAFEVIDAVEIDTLRDVMRLQVIEALIIPEKLPLGLVRQ